ncbi:MAG: O-antigen ligase family protein [Candidatus Nanopelagicaceae bacterium]
MSTNSLGTMAIKALPRSATGEVAGSIRVRSGVLAWLLGGASVITLFFNSRIQDPFNSPKFWILLVVAGYLIGHLFGNRGKVPEDAKPTLRILIVVLTLFTVALFIASLVTDVWYVAFFGEYQRKNGFLTYAAFVIILYAAARYLRVSLMWRVYTFAMICGLISAVYGLFQINGRDFVQWNNPYNAIITTVGNPNFAGAVMAMFGTIVFCAIFDRNVLPIFRVLAVLVFGALVYTIYLSQARQGLLSIGLGVGFFMVIALYQYRRLLGILAGVAVGVVGILAVAGILQRGPLEDYLYKGSVSVRGFYWRAGWEMFLSNPLFGVGVDRYGAYFKEYRETQYSLNYGFDLTSSNAHNVPIQLFATGGIFVGGLYLLLMGFIAWRGFVGIYKNQGNARLVVTAVFAAWLAYQAQSIVSIDNIGLAVWGWLLGGAVVGLSLSENVEVFARNRDKRFVSPLNLKQATVSTALVLLFLVLSTILYRGERAMFDQRVRFDPSTPESRPTFKAYADATLTVPLLEMKYAVMTGINMVSNGYVDEGMRILESELERDPRSLDILLVVADFSEQLRRPNDAIRYRLRIEALDPWNGKNHLQLARLYLAQGRTDDAKFFVEKLLAFAADTQEGESAKQEFASLIN